LLSALREEKIDANLCVGQIVNGFSELPGSYRAAEFAWSGRLLYGKNNVIVYDELPQLSPRAIPVAEEDIRALCDAADAMDNEQCKRVIHRIFSAVRPRLISVRELRLLSMHLVLCGLRQIPLDQFQMDQSTKETLFSLESLDRFSDLEELEEHICDIFFSLNHDSAIRQIPKKKDMIQEIKAYICEHLSENMNLNRIAEEFFINPIYFSQLFKKKTGMHYKDYVTHLRIEKAKRLLETTDLTLSKICAYSGYRDPYYFSTVFEKETGQKLSSYRALHRQEK